MPTTKSTRLRLRTIVKEIKDIIPAEEILALETKPLPRSKKEAERLIKEKEKEMKLAASELEFELAAILRDEIAILKSGGRAKKEVDYIRSRRK